MKILLIGGTRFVGRHIVNELFGRGYRPTLFNRGTNNVFPQLRTIAGDRDNPGDLAKIADENWDVVIDTCAYFPRQVRMLKDAMGPGVRYVLISSISVYKDQDIAYQAEDADVIELPENTPEKITGETYGGLKALCETAAKCVSNAPLIIRPGLIVGPYDTTDRFSFWPFRALNQARVLVPDCPRLPVQFIDARDLSVFIADSIEKGLSGIFNLVNSPGEFCFHDLITACFTRNNSRSVPIVVSEKFLLDNKVQPWVDLPFWSPGSECNFMLTSNEKARNSGLKTRSIEETIKDLSDWFVEVDKKTQQAGMPSEKEELLLQQWERLNCL